MYELYKFNDVTYLNTHSVKDRLEITPNKIEKKRGDNFKIEILKESISFIVNSRQYLYHLKDYRNRHETKNFIEKSFFIEFKKKLEKINLIKNTGDYNCVEFFYNLLSNYDKVDFLIVRIVYNQGSALNYIFSYILLSMRIIEKNEFYCITGEKEGVLSVVKNIITRIITMLSYRLSDVSLIETYLIKICLILEAEKYINEHDVNNEYVFKSLKDVWTLIESKYDEKIWFFFKKTECFNIAKVIKEVENFHISNIIRYKKEILKNVCKIVSLFTGLSSSRFLYENTKEAFRREEIIKNLRLNENEIEKKTKVIKKNLSKKTEEDKIYERKRKLKEEELKKIKEIMKRSSLAEKLDEILFTALIGHVGNIFDEEIGTDFENKLIKRSKIVIENTIKALLKKEKLQEDTINDYKNECEEAFLETLRQHIEYRLTKKASDYIHNNLIDLFKCEFQEDIDEKINSEKTLKNNLLVLDEKKILELINVQYGEDLHKIFIRAIKNNEKKNK
ncbi:uncharacterized protein VNE69_08116 [Vairimorpha necatrix]|uniref:Uncharacterized protein n=1 Tax=Vairimorpha necatrix TaxID=6039 RepID=A0AAX4JEG6_9MICR